MESFQYSTVPWDDGVVIWSPKVETAVEEQEIPCTMRTDLLKCVEICVREWEINCICVCNLF